MNKQLRKDDVVTTPFLAMKDWALSNNQNGDVVLTEAGNPVALEFISYGAGDGQPEWNTTCNVAKEQQEMDKINVRDGLKRSGLFYPDLEPTNLDGTFKRIIFSQIKEVFYNNYRDPTRMWGMEYIDFERSQTKKFLADSFRLFDVPRIVFGEKIQESSVNVIDNTLDDPYTITDDGFCNLIAGTNIFSRFQEIEVGENYFLESTDHYCDSYLNFNDVSGTYIGLTASIFNTESSLLIWDTDMSYHDGFVILRSSDSGSTWATVGIIAASQTGAYDSPLEISGTYWYEVYAYNIFGTSSHSNTASVYNWAPPTASIILYASVPTGSLTQSYLNWDDNFDNEKNFIIERSVDSGSTWTLLQTLSANVTESYDDTIVTSSWFWYRVHAYNDYSSSDNSNTASVLNWYPPAAPSSLSASFEETTASIDTRIRLNWTDNANNELGFRLERSNDSASTFPVSFDIAANVSTSVDTNVFVIGGTTYWYRVQSYNAYTSSAWSNTIAQIVFNPPTTPSVLSSSLTAGSASAEVSLSWVDNSNNELSFSIERSNNSGSTFTEIQLVATNVTESVDESVLVVGGTTYWYRVSAYNLYGTSSWTSVVTQSVFVPPAAPSGLSGSLITDSSSAEVFITWVDESSNEIGFSLERSNDSGSSFTQLNHFGPGVESYYDTTSFVLGGTTFWYRIASYNIFGTSSWSDILTQSVFAMPATPSDLSASLISDSSSAEVYLTWNDNAVDEVGYYMERSNDSGSSFSPLSMIGKDVVSFYDTNSLVVGGTTYWYRIRSYNVFGSSSWSNIATQSVFSPPAAPSALSGSIVSTTSSVQVDLTWTDNSSNEIGFYMERSSNSGSTFNTSSNFAKNVSSSYDTDVVFYGGSTYWYRIAAWNIFATSSWSNVLTQSIWDPPVEPTSLSSSLTDHPTTPFVTLTWDDVSANEDGFEIERSNDSGSTYVTISVLGPNTESYVDSNVLVFGGTTYWYRVRAFNVYTSSIWSNEISQTVYQPPAAPTQLTASFSEPSCSYLRWNDNADNEDGYIVERAPGTSSIFSWLQSVGADVTGTFDYTTLEGETYTYRVAAYNIYDSSSWSNTASVVISVDYLYDQTGSKYLSGPYDSFEAYMTPGMVPANRGYGWASGWVINTGAPNWMGIVIAEEDFEDPSIVEGATTSASNTGYGWTAGFSPEFAPPSMSVIFIG